MRFMLKTRIRNIFLVIITVFSTSILYSPVTQANDSDLLQQIADNTLGLLTQFNEFALAWLNPDESETTADLQANLTNYMNYTWDNNDTQLSIQQNLLQDYFSSSAPPYANDLSYPILLGQPFVSEKDPDKLKASALNYTKYASGLNIKHLLPSQGWAGTKENKDKYENFYKTISAVQTYNVYILSDFYANYANGLQLTNVQNELKDQASSPDWFKHIASEASIGILLRQILMFNSQMYLLAIQSLETQKQLIAAIAMTNSLIILGNQFNENNLLDKALGKT